MGALTVDDRRLSPLSNGSRSTLSMPPSTCFCCHTGAMGENEPRSEPLAFLSHASEDKADFVEPLAHALVKRGVRPWLDRWEIKPGDSLVQRLFDEGLDRADAIVVVLSRFSLTRSWVRAELDSAIVKRIWHGTRVIPVRLDKVEIPSPLTSLAWLSGERSFDDIQRIAQEIADVLLDNPPAPRVEDHPPFTLPPDFAGFVGREKETRILLDELSSDRSSLLVISAVSGLAGVGKTTLAVHVAHIANARGLFSGGTLFLDLNGFGAQPPMKPRRALIKLLRMLGVADAALPAATADMATLYQTQLARRADTGQRVLVVADNAATESQVAQLMPANDTHRLIITSRRTLAGLAGTRHIDLEVLTPTEARNLVADAVLTARPDDDRVSAAEPALLEELTELCGHLPLALSIVSALLIAQPYRSIADLTASLRDTRTRLTHLEYDSGDRTIAVRTAFALSFARLDEETATVFRAFGLHAGREPATEALAAAVDLTPATARRILDRLAQSHLVNALADGSRWRQHDLLHLYARELADALGEPDRHTAITRVSRHYADHAETAHDNAEPPTENHHDAIADGDAARTWFAIEWSNLTAAAQAAAEIGDGESVWRLALASTSNSDLPTPHEEWANLQVLARDQATSRGNWPIFTKIGIQLAIYHRERRDTDRALHQIREVRRLVREHGNEIAEAEASHAEAEILRDLGKLTEAEPLYRKSIEIQRRHNLLLDLGWSLHGLGDVLCLKGEYDEAMAAQTECLTIFTDVGDLFGQAWAIHGQADIHRERGDFPAAIEAIELALHQHELIGNRSSQAWAYVQLGDVHLRAGQITQATDAFRQAADAFDERGNDVDKARALHQLGQLEEQLGNLTQAHLVWQEALELDLSTDPELRHQLIDSRTRLDRTTTTSSIGDASLDL